MDATTRRKYSVGGILLAVFTTVLAINRQVVVHGEDDYCFWRADPGECVERSSKSCSGDWYCAESKDKDCVCVKLPLPN